MIRVLVLAAAHHPDPNTWAGLRDTCAFFGAPLHVLGTTTISTTRAMTACIGHRVSAERRFNLADDLRWAEQHLNRILVCQDVYQMTTEVEVHPVQTHQSRYGDAKCPKLVTMAAYEVYCHVFSPQVEMVTGTCRGGFSAGELIAFLYARSFPKNEWRDRVDQALRGMKSL